MSSFFISAFACSAVAIALVVLYPGLQHWYVVPVTLGGAIIATDAVDWLRGRFDVFDPVGVLGLFGVHFFFLAPLLHVIWDRWISSLYWAAIVPPPPDWRPWLGWMALMNLAGLLAYRLSRHIFAASSAPHQPVSGAAGSVGPSVGATATRSGDYWRLMPRRFWPAVALAAAISIIAQLAVYRSFGGLGGYIGAFEQNRSAFAGLGFLFLIAESGPILLLFGFAAYAHWRGLGGKRAPSWLVLIAVLLAFFLLRMLFGGLRGSRSNTVWALFWAVGVIHLWIRPIPKRVIVGGLLFVMTFMYMYGFYKAVGRDALRAFEGAQAREDLAYETGRSLDAMILGDLGRSDIQAFVLYRHQIGQPLAHAYGRTYAGAMALLIPRSIWPTRPHTKLKEGTELFYGRGAYVPNHRRVSFVYGLSGEAMLNFGPWAVPLAFAGLGVFISLLQRRIRRYRAGDVRLLMVPLFVNLGILALVADADNIVFFVVKNGALPMLVVLLATNRIILPTPGHPPNSNSQRPLPLPLPLPLNDSQRPAEKTDARRGRPPP